MGPQAETQPPVGAEIEGNGCPPNGRRLTSQFSTKARKLMNADMNRIGSFVDMAMLDSSMKGGHALDQQEHQPWEIDLGDLVCQTVIASGTYGTVRVSLDFLLKEVILIRSFYANRFILKKEKDVARGRPFELFDLLFFSKCWLKTARCSLREIEIGSSLDLLTGQAARREVYLVLRTVVRRRDKCQQRPNSPSVHSLSTCCLLPPLLSWILDVFWGSNAVQCSVQKQANGN